MDHPRTNLGVLRSKKKLPLSLLFKIKHINYDFRKNLRLSEKYQNDNKILNGHANIDPKFKKEDEFDLRCLLVEASTGENIYAHKLLLQ